MLYGYCATINTGIPYVLVILNIRLQFDGLVQERRNSSASAHMELIIVVSSAYKMKSNLWLTLLISFIYIMKEEDLNRALWDTSEQWTGILFDAIYFYVLRSIG